MKSLCSIFIGCTLLLLASSCGVRKGLKVLPNLSQFDTIKPHVEELSATNRITDFAYLTRNKHQLWELYVTGDSYQIGLKTGALTQDLYQNQETVFFSKVEEMVPTGFRQKGLIKLLKYYNRHLYRYIPEEYQTEIYGISTYATPRFDYLGDAYHRNLYLHGAHDIGHAFQDLALVGCTSVAAWGPNTADGTLLIGRNFDFYVGDDFAKNKLVTFVKPKTGYGYASVTWPGMVGVVSGMNEKGLTVTLNAGKSTIPLKAKTPISIVAREIVQYAATLEEAIAIAKNKQVFVSESLLIGSAADQKAVLIEMAPKKFGVYEVANSNTLICSNHFQSQAFENDVRNRNHIKVSHSQYRWDRMQQLLNEQPPLTPQKMVDLLRNTKGLNNRALGYGNEKALNQLLGHHAVVFQPEKKLMWVSAPPYQLGEFVAYDLEEIFAKPFDSLQSHALKQLTIPADEFVNSQAFLDYETYRVRERELETLRKKGGEWDAETWHEYQQLNPDYWKVYYQAGLYYYNKKQYETAKIQFETALQKEIPTTTTRAVIEKYLKKTNRKWKHK